MSKRSPFIKLLMLHALILCSLAIFGQINGSAEPDLQTARKITDSLDRLFSKLYYEGDSLALAAFYTNDATFGTLKGKEILSYWGRSIQQSVKNKTRDLSFRTTSLTVDSGFIVELGVFESKDEAGEIKSQGKYLVVWKQEGGRWKIHRDMGL